MNPTIRPGLVPPEPGLDKEEPEQSHEDDIPADDGTITETPPAPSKERPLRQVERE